MKFIELGVINILKLFSSAYKKFLAHLRWYNIKVVSQTEKEILYDITYMWNLKNSTNELTKQKQTH